MQVIVKYTGPVSRIVGKKEELIELEDNATLLELMRKLSYKHSGLFGKNIFEKGSATPYGLNIFVNGQNILFIDGLATRLKNGDKVALVSPLGGG